MAAEKGSNFLKVSINLKNENFEIFVLKKKRRGKMTGVQKMALYFPFLLKLFLKLYLEMKH